MSLLPFLLVIAALAALAVVAWPGGYAEAVAPGREESLPVTGSDVRKSRRSASGTREAAQELVRRFTRGRGGTDWEVHLLDALAGPVEAPVEPT